MRRNDEYYTALEYKYKAQQRRIADFESGAEYQKLKKVKDDLLAELNQTSRTFKEIIRKLEKELENISGKWLEVVGDVEKEKDKEILVLKKKLQEKEEELQKEKEENKRLKEQLKAGRKEITEVRSELMDKQEKIEKLDAQLHQNFKNSSVPSSASNFRGVVTNNREKSGKKAGGQPGHKGHARKHYEADNSVFIPAPEEITSNPDWYEQTGETGEIHKQKVTLNISVQVTDYWSKVYRNRKTGARYHAPFPDGLTLDVTYDDGIRAVIFLLKNHANVSEGKISELFNMLTKGKLKISTGMINGINKEFSKKSESEQKEIFEKLMKAPVMHTDMTNVRKNGKLKNIIVCTDKENVYYAFRNTKGDAAVQGTPLEFFAGTVIHDHDKTFYHYGISHQECNEHNKRYLKGAAEIETELTWHMKMRELLIEMNKTRENQKRILGEEQVMDFERRYDGILDLADKEYNDNPPSQYNRKGFNLKKKLRVYREPTLGFLRNPTLDFTNNEAERTLRKIKRHMVNSGTFRGMTDASAEEYAASMSVLQTIRNKDGDCVQLLLYIAGIFRRNEDRKERERDEKGRFRTSTKSSSEADSGVTS